MGHVCFQSIHLFMNKHHNLRNFLYNSCDTWVVQVKLGIQKSQDSLQIGREVASSMPRQILEKRYQTLDLGITNNDYAALYLPAIQAV